MNTKNFLRAHASFFVIVGAFFLILFIIQANLAGPFVFADEAEYRGMAHSILVGNFLKGYQQYGPLYPAIISVSTYLFSPRNFYQFIHALNIFSAVIFLFPFWLLVKIWLKSSRLQWVALLCFIFNSCWAFIIVTWAEPLFYGLFSLSVYLFFQAVNKEDGSSGRFFILGIVLGLLFLAKSIGVFYWIAVIISFSLLFWRKLFSEKAVRLNLFLLFLGGAVFIFPWMLRNVLSEHPSLLGYSYLNQSLMELFRRETLVFVLYDFARAFLFQLSYLVTASIGTIFLTFYFFYRRWATLSIADKAIALYLIFALGAVCLVSAINVVALVQMKLIGIGYWTPNGRYLTFFTPFFVLLSLYLIQKMSASKERDFFCLEMLMILGLGALVFFATPLYSILAFMLPNSPDLSFYSILFQGFNINWASFYEPSFWEKLTPVALVFLIVIPCVFFRHCSKLLKVIAALSIIYFALSLAAQSLLLRQMAQTQKYINSFFSEFSSKRVEFCESKNLFFDEKLKNGNFDFVYQYWCPDGKAKFAALEGSCKAAKKSNFCKTASTCFFVTDAENHPASFGGALLSDKYHRISVFRVSAAIFKDEKVRLCK